MQYQSSMQNQRRATGQTGAVDQVPTETTRYLCAAAHVDEKFRNYVFHTIVEEEHKAIGELYGADIIPIVQWAFAARQRVLNRDIWLSLLLIATIVISVAVFGTSHYYSYDSFSGYGSNYDVPPSFWTYVLGIPLGLILFGLLSLIPSALLAVIVPFLLVYTFIAARNTSLLLLLVLWLSAWMMVLIEAGICYYGAKAKLLTKNSFGSEHVHAPLDEALQQKLRAINAMQGGNAIIYSGFSPFIGSGLDIGGWSITVDLSKGKREAGTQLTPTAFRVNELYSVMDQAIKQLKIGNLAIEDRLFVNGQEIRNNKDFLPNPQTRPQNQVQPAMVQYFADNPSQDIRYYKCIRVTSWKGELVFSMFIRFTFFGSNLFIEVNYLLLPPLKEGYYWVDTVNPALTLRKLRKLLGSTFAAAPGLWFRAPSKVIAAMFHSMLVQRRHRRIQGEIYENSAFDYGASSSLREFASSTMYRRHFQKLDKEMYVKVIEGQLLKQIISFLDAKNVDTGELQQRQDAIINNGIMVSGSTFHGDNVAIGDRARATLSNITQTIRGTAQGNTNTGRQQANGSS